jgi:hypothetical protein
MSQKVTQMLLLLAIPGVAWFVLYQVDPDLVDPSSPNSLLALVITIDKAAKMADADLGKTDAPIQLLNILRRSFESTDSLFAHRGPRDPMKPLMAVGGSGLRPAREIQQPAQEMRFPLKTGDIDGIFWIPGAPQVVIQGQRYRTGAEVKGARITAIDRNSVTFQWKDQSYVIDLSKPKIN